MKPLNRYQIFSSMIAVLLLVAWAAGIVNADPVQQPGESFGSVDQYVSEQMSRLGIPGMELGITHGDKIVHLQGFGVADFTGRRVTTETPFQIGSVTKPFTALAIMQLVEAGKIDLDAPVQKYLPWFTLADKDAAARMTVRNLLNHASGLSTTAGNRLWPSQQNLEDAVRGMNTWSVARPVGSTYQYSNVNFSIAGLIVEKVSGQSYSDYVAQHIFGPLGMQHSYASRMPALADGLSAGHYYMLGHAFQMDGPLPPSYLPSGMLISNAEDLTHFAIAQLNGGHYGNASVLSPRGVAQMHAPAIPMMVEGYRYAMGWGVGEFDGMPVLRHDGDTGRFHAMVLLQPDQRWGVILLSNASGFVEIPQTDEIAKNVLLMLNGKKPASVFPPAGMRFLYWTILLIPVLQVILFVYGLRLWFTGVQRARWLLVVVTLFNLAVAYLFLFQLPGHLIPFELAPLLNLYPELGCALLLGGGLGIGEAVAFARLYVRSMEQSHAAFRPSTTEPAKA